MGLTRRTHNIVHNHFQGREKNVAVDATCGNGFDTEFLAKIGFKTIYAFDVQPKAITSSRTRLHNAGIRNTQFILDGHENMKQHITRSIDCVMFNFGYLPNADQSVTTSAKTSLDALEAGLDLMSPHGLMTLLCYPGHSKGATETNAVRNRLNHLASDWLVETHLASVPKPSAPILLVIKRNQ